jgi:hypothetical protein
MGIVKAAGAEEGEIVYLPQDHDLINIQGAFNPSLLA